MKVREAVFVQEQGVPLEFEFDQNDSRSAHWVAYSDTIPIGTVRLVPFPHESHPARGGVYVNDKLVGYMDGTATERGRQEGTGKEMGRDRATTFHDGSEPYVKIGRLAVVKEKRRSKVGAWLVSTALEWLRTHPDIFDHEGMRWNGLVCAHGQVQAVRAWERMGFQMDEDMGRWMEEGIEHVGMWIRLDIVDAAGARHRRQ